MQLILFKNLNKLHFKFSNDTCLMYRNEGLLLCLFSFFGFRRLQRRRISAISRPKLSRYFLFFSSVSNVSKLKLSGKLLATTPKLKKMAHNDTPEQTRQRQPAAETHSHKRRILLNLLHDYFHKRF